MMMLVGLVLNLGIRDQFRLRDRFDLNETELKPVTEREEKVLCENYSFEFIVTTRTLNMLSLLFNFSKDSFTG